MIGLTDRELLEGAARAAGIEIDHWRGNSPMVVELFRGHLENYIEWNPLTDDGDALRLAVKLGLPTGFDDRFKQLGSCAYATYPASEDSCDSIFQSVEEAGGEAPAMRRAIVRAAYEIGRAKP